MNPIQKDPHMTELHICIFVFYKYICYDIVIFNEFSNFVWNMFNAKTIKVRYIFIIHMQTLSFILKTLTSYNCFFTYSYYSLS